MAWVKTQENELLNLENFYEVSIYDPGYIDPSVMAYSRDAERTLFTGSAEKCETAMYKIESGIIREEELIDLTD